MVSLLNTSEKAVVSQLGLQRLLSMALVDPLTKLPNRNHLALELEQRRETDQRTVYVRIDLDGFKKAQDHVVLKPDGTRSARGHEWGDGCLADFARYVQSCVRNKSDVFAAREGGDEFVILTNSALGALCIAARIVRWHYQDVVTASCGMGPTVEVADAALYKAKASKKKPRWGARSMTLLQRLVQMGSQNVAVRYRDKTPAAE